VTAHVDTCGLERTSSGKNIYYIRCRLINAVGPELNVTSLYSMHNQIGLLKQWIDEHAPGTPILVRYDPAKQTTVVSTDVLDGGPHTQSNIKLLEVCAGSFIILLAIARITRSRSLGNADVLQSH